MSNRRDGRGNFNGGGIKRASRSLVALTLATTGAMLAFSCDDEPPSEPDQTLAFEKRSQRYLAGLDETVTIVKGLNGRYAVRADGSIHRVEDLEIENRAAWRVLHGTLTPEVVTYSQALAADVLVDVAILFEPDIDWAAYFDAQASGDALMEQAQADLLEVAIADTAGAIIAELEALGIDEVESDPWAPIVQASVPNALLSTVAELPMATRIIPNGETAAVENSNDVIDPLAFHQRSALSGYTGGTQRLGVIDPGVCRLRATHNWIDTTVNYEAAGTPCVTSAQCTTGACGANLIPNVCVAGKCIDGHGHAVTSVLTRFATDAPVYYPNGGAAPNGPACVRQIVAAYSYLRTNFVRFVNESFNCDDAPPGGLSPTDGVVQDYYARAHNFLITKSAGNGGDGSSACLNTWNSVCVGAVDAEAEQACFSSTDNPLIGTSSYIDREEPDVMAAGGQKDCTSGELDAVTAAGAGSNTQQVLVNGTSFSAPAVLGMAAVFDQYCVAQGFSLDSVKHRSLLRTAAYGDNPDGWRYSTLQPGMDHLDGAGVLYLNKLKRFCDPSQPSDDEHGFTGGRWTMGTFGNTTPLPEAAPEYPDAPPQSAPQDQGLEPSPSLTGYKWTDLWANTNISSFPVGTRVRVTFSWEACVTTADPSANRTVPTDFDLFLYNATLGKGLYASQTDDDVNEGFDITIPEGWAGDYDLIVVWPASSTGCSGVERTGTSWWISRP